MMERTAKMKTTFRNSTLAPMFRSFESMSGPPKKMLLSKSGL